MHVYMMLICAIMLMKYFRGMKMQNLTKNIEGVLRLREKAYFNIGHFKKGHFNHFKKSVYKNAFSLVEILVGLIVMSCIMSAMAPIVTKKMKKSSATLSQGGGGGGLPIKKCKENFGDDCVNCEKDACLVCNKDCNLSQYKDIKNCTCVDCSTKFGTNCLTCQSNICTKCDSGYYLDGTTCTICPVNSMCDGMTKVSCPEGSSTKEQGGVVCISKGGESCPAGETLKDGNCVACSTAIPNCLACSSNGGCLACAEGFTNMGTSCKGVTYCDYCTFFPRGTGYHSDIEVQCEGGDYASHYSGNGQKCYEWANLPCYITNNSRSLSFVFMGRTVIVPVTLIIEYTNRSGSSNRTAILGVDGDPHRCEFRE